MKASVVVAPARSEIHEVSLPEIGPQDVLMRVAACGVCTSEVHRWNGHGSPIYPLRLGHEPSGVVEQVGSSVHTWGCGQRVAALAPGKGAYAEYIVVPEQHLIAIPEDMPFTAALAEPLGCLVSGLERVPLKATDRVGIIGCGFMGLALLQMVRHSGVGEIIAVDTREEARRNALRMGADLAVAPDDVQDEHKVTAWKDIGQGLDVVFETTGVQAALTLAGAMTGVHGTLSIVGWHWDGLRSVDIGLWNWKAITVVNAHERRMDHLVRCMQRGLELVEYGIVNMDSLVTHTYSLARVDDAFHAMTAKTPGFIKAVVVPWT